MNNDPITISVQRGPASLTMTLPWDANANELAQSFRTILLHLGFDFGTVMETIPDGEDKIAPDPAFL